MKQKKIDEDYFKWLCYIIDINKPDGSHSLLAKDLHRKVFYSIVPNDENRANDGIALRDRYLDMVMEESVVKDDMNPPLYGQPSTVFEVLVGIAMRMEDIMFNPDLGDRTSNWFWELLDNLDLSQCNDSNYGSIYCAPLVIDNILNALLEREYKRNGKGGLFPLKNTRDDQRNIEIWYQMHAYISENYEIGGEI